MVRSALGLVSPRRIGGLLAVAVLAVAIVALVGTIRPASGQTAAPVVSVVFAIDNSGSMSGGQGSDPTAQRVEGVRRIVDILQGFLAGGAGGRDVRIGAVSFGYDSALLAPLQSVMEPGLSASLRAEDRGGTDLAEALCAAWTVAVRQAPPAASGCDVPPGVVGQAEGSTPPVGPERRLVVLVTDGSPAPSGAPLALDASPAASACGESSLTTTDGDAYLCALGDTWSSLNAAAEVELIVIGLDQRDAWFAQTEAYWQRIVGCGGRGDACDNAVVRSIDAESLADLILRLFPLIDLCDSVRREAFTCDVPGGLASVGFQFTGIGSDTRTVLGSEGAAHDSAESPAELRATEASHVWTLGAPSSGAWTAESNGPSTQRLYIQYEPALFDAGADQWGDDGLQLSLVSRSDLDLPSAEAQDYYLQIRQDGVPIDNATVRVESRGGREFGLLAPLPRPAFAPGSKYEVVVSIDLTPMHEVARLVVDETLLDKQDDEDEEIIVVPPPCAVHALWQYVEVAPRHELGVRLGFPLLRFRVPADWAVTFDGTDCEGPFEVHAGVADCETCVADGTGGLPLVLSLPAPRGGPSAERDISWYDQSTGREEFLSDSVRIEDNFLVRTEPVWATLFYLALLGLALVGVSAWAVRQPQSCGDDEKVAPIELGLEHRGWAHPLVRWRTFVYRPVPADLDGPGSPRTVMLRYFIAGPLVLRGGEATGAADGPSWWQGRLLCETDIRPQRLQPKAHETYSPF